MKKRILSGVLLACIIVPTFFWFKDVIVSSVSGTAVASVAYDLVYGAKRWILQLVVVGREEALQHELATIDSDIKSIESVIASIEDSVADRVEVESLRMQLAALLLRRQEAVSELQNQLAQMNHRRLEAEHYFLAQQKHDAVRREWQTVTRIVGIKASLAAHESGLEQNRMASAVNQFLDAISELDVESARRLSAPALASELSMKRLLAMKRGIPSEIEEGFELRPASDFRTFEVWTGDGHGPLVTLTRDRDDWLIASVGK